MLANDPGPIHRPTPSWRVYVPCISFYECQVGHVGLLACAFPPLQFCVFPFSSKQRMLFLNYEDKHHRSRTGCLREVCSLLVSPNQARGHVFAMFPFPTNMHRWFCRVLWVPQEINLLTSPVQLLYFHDVTCDIRVLQFKKPLLLRSAIWMFHVF